MKQAHDGEAYYCRSISSMRRLDFLHLDVFTSRQFEGNQLAVFLDGRGLDASAMQTIAREMNFSAIPLGRYAEQDDAPGVVVIVFGIFIGSALLAAWIVKRPEP